MKHSPSQLQISPDGGVRRRTKREFQSNYYWTICIMKQTWIFAGAMLLGLLVGGHIVGHIFFGLMLLGGLIALVENIPLIKWFVYKGNNIMDIVLWVLSAMAIVSFGVTIAAALAVASLGYTMVYAPYVRRKVREQAVSKNKNKHSIKF